VLHHTVFFGRSEEAKSMLLHEWSEPQVSLTHSTKEGSEQTALDLLPCALSAVETEISGLGGRIAVVFMKGYFAVPRLYPLHSQNS
jgi:hypothetical protein